MNFFNIDRFMPHGHCYQWDPNILWTSVISDALIAAAYIAIPFTLVFQIMRRRNDLPFNWMFACFGMFIVACGCTHVMEIITVWTPLYGVSVLVKALTAAASVPTAIILFRIAPKIVKFPSVEQLVEEKTRRTRAEAANQAKDRFIAALSHELRTPLTPVRAGLDLIEDELRTRHGLTDSVEQTLRMIRNNVDMETVLINDLLDLSSSVHDKYHFDLEPVDLRDVFEDALPRFQQEINRKKLQLQQNFRATRTIVSGAPIRLHQIVNNLLDNAIKYTPSGGTITVTLSNDTWHLRLTVKDTGVGIEPQNLEKIFQPFEQLNRRGENARSGIGLGLTIAKAMAEAQQGHLIAESDGLNQGASFTLEMPLSDERAPGNEPPPAAKSIAPDPSGKPRLLVVDDHPDTLKTLAFLLRRVGFPVQTAESVTEAETRLSECEILVSDISLPDGTGWDLMRLFKARGGRIGFAVSGLGQAEDIQRSRDAGFARHFVKPNEITDLIRTLQELPASPV